MPLQDLNNAPVSTSQSTERPYNTQAREAPLSPNVWFNSIANVDRSASPPLLPSPQGPQCPPNTTAGSFAVYDLMDRRIAITTADDIPADVPIRVTVSFEVKNGYMTPQISKVTILSVRS